MRHRLGGGAGGAFDMRLKEGGAFIYVIPNVAAGDGGISRPFKILGMTGHDICKKITPKPLKISELRRTIVYWKTMRKI